MRKPPACLLILCLITLLTPLAYAEGGEMLTLSFIGDCSMGEMVESTNMPESYTDTLDREGFSHPFDYVRDILLADDFTFANNELVYTKRNAHDSKRYNLRAAPEYAQAWLGSGVDAVNTANNHAMDFFKEGYEDSIAALDEYGIQNFGTLYPGNKKREQDRLGVYEVRGVKIGAVSCSYPQTEDAPVILARVDKLKKEEGCALVIASLHWGREEKTSPESWQFTFARKLIDGGVDVIWGHHPHILQQVMFYKGKPIMFSTGNFTFGSIAKLDSDTGIFQLRYEIVDGQLSLNRFSVIPCRTQGKPDYRPILVTDEKDKMALYKKLIYRKNVKNMVNLPDSFLETGAVDIVNGELLSSD